MSFRTLCEWIQETWLSQSISGSTWGYPILGAIHVLGIALFGGAVLLEDLRILGLAMRQQPYSQIVAQLSIWKWTGACVVLSSGVLLFWSGPVRYSSSTFFRIKMLLLLLVAVNAGVFHFKHIRRRRGEWNENASAPAGAKLAAWLSLALWTGIIFAARGTAFF